MRPGAKHKYHALLDGVRDRVRGACEYCAGAYGVKDAIEETEFALLDDYDGHPSVRDLMEEGYKVVTF